jgi:hypothetical protein
LWPITMGIPQLLEDSGVSGLPSSGLSFGSIVGTRQRDPGRTLFTSVAFFPFPGVSMKIFFVILSHHQFLS